MKQFLTIQEMQDELNKITYRPGWKFTIRQGAFEGAHLEIEAMLEDSVNVGQKMLFNPQIPIASLQDNRRFSLMVNIPID